MERNPKFKQDSKWHKSSSLDIVHMSFLMSFMSFSNVGKLSLSSFDGWVHTWRSVELYEIHSTHAGRGHVTCPQHPLAQWCCRYIFVFPCKSYSIRDFFLSFARLLCLDTYIYIRHAQFKEFVAATTTIQNLHTSNLVCGKKSSGWNIHILAHGAHYDPCGIEVFWPSSSSFKYFGSNRIGNSCAKMVGG